jgi:hypothetical protein
LGQGGVSWARPGRAKRNKARAKTTRLILEKSS